MKITQTTYLNDASTTLSIEFPETPDAKTIFDVLHAIGGEVDVVSSSGGEKSPECWGSKGEKVFKLQESNQVSLIPNLETWEESAEEEFPVFFKATGYGGIAIMGLTLDSLKELGDTLLSLHKHLKTLKESV